MVYFRRIITLHTGGMAMQSLEWSKDLQLMFRQNQQNRETRNLTVSEQKAVQQVNKKASQTTQVETVWA